MLTRGRLLFIFLSLSTVFLVGGSMMSVSAREKVEGKDSMYKYLSVFTEVLGLVRRAYVDETVPDSLMAGALEGATDALGPFALFVPENELETYLAGREIGMGRSGLRILKERGTAYVAALQESGPAAKAGVGLGDIISMMQGRPTRDMPLWEIQTVLGGTVGDEIRLERIRLGQKEELRFELEDFVPKGVILEARRGVPVLRLSEFGSKTFERVAGSLEAVEAASLPGLQDADKLVLDLRGLAGGDVSVAYRVAGLFATGELGFLARRGETLETFQGSLKALWDGKIVVLVNRGTQGAAEVLATVLKQTVEATLVGEPTFGHSGRLQLVKLSDGSRLQMTDAFYSGPDLRPINRALEPDLPVAGRIALDDQDEEEAAAEGEPAEDGEEAAENETAVSDPILERGLKILLGEEEVPAVREAA